MTELPRFATVVVDVDSTLSGIEGIDWLAEMRGPEVARRVAEMTTGAMEGDTDLENVYGERLGIVRPTQLEVGQLAKAYISHLAPGAAEAISALQEADVRVVIVSGGIRQAVLLLADAVGVDPDDVHAVRLRFNADGRFSGHDRSPLCSATGKLDLLKSLGLDAPILVVGDGSTDLAMRGGAEAFAAFTGFVQRDAVVRAADYEISSFAELIPLVLVS